MVWRFGILLCLIFHVDITFQEELPKIKTPYSVERASDEVILQLLVEAGKVDCFYQPIVDPKHVSIDLDYQVTEGGEMDITFFMKNPTGAVIAMDPRKSEGTHRIKIDGDNGYGDYTFCFDNSFSVRTKKHIFFELFLLDKDGNFFNNFNEFSGKDILTPLLSFETITATVKSNMNEMERLQTQIRALEARDRHIMEENFEIVNFWSIINITVMSFVFGIQVLIIRSLFIDDSKLGNLIRKGRLND